MAFNALRKLNPSCWFGGLWTGNRRDAPPETSCYSDSEIASIRQHLQEGNAAARQAARARGYKLHPKIVAAKARVEA